MPTTNIRVGNAYDQMASATQQLFGLISQKAGDIAIEEATTQAARDVESGKAPKQFAPGITEATSAYNKAVSNIEATHIVDSARNQIQEAYIRYTDPAVYDSESPAKFHAELNGIVNGTLSNTRDENREKVQHALSALTSHASNQMLSHAISFDNRQTKETFKQDFSSLAEQRRNAAVIGDAEAVAHIDTAMESLLDNYGKLNKEIAASVPQIRKELEQRKEVDESLGSLTKAISENKAAEWMKDLAENKQGYSFSTWQQVAKGAEALYNENNKLKTEIQTIGFYQAQRDIDKGAITTDAQIMALPNNTVVQKLHLQSYLDRVNKQAGAQQQKIVQAQNDIKNGHQGAIPDSTKNAMFDASTAQIEQSTGKAASVFEQANSILGLNPFPSSGMPGVPLKTNVPKFDSTISNLLTSGDPIQIAQGGAVYQHMIAMGSPNSIHLDGQALAVASLYRTLAQGEMAPEMAAALANKAVLQAKEPEVQERTDRFHRMYEGFNQATGKAKLFDLFKQDFGTAPKDFDSDAAFRTYHDVFRAQYLFSNSEDAARAAAKYSMRGWGTSKYFPDGLVANPVPEKEVPVSQAANAFHNQIHLAVQDVVRKNAALRAQGFNVTSVEWANKSSQIDINKLTDADKVFKNLGDSEFPMVKVNGHLSPVKIIPGPGSRLGNRFTYQLVYFDQFGMQQSLPDPTNQLTHAALFSPVGLDAWAPSVNDEQLQKKFEATAEKMLEKQNQAMVAKMAEVTKQHGLQSAEKYLSIINDLRPQQTKQELVDSLMGKKSLPSVPQKITDSDVLGVKSLASLLGEE